MRSDLLLLGHGSRDPEGAAEFLRLVRAVARTMPGRRVAGGVLEFAGPVAPAIRDAADAIVRAGATEVVAQPVLLFRATHGKADMPAQLREMAARHPGVRFRLGRSFGLRPELIDVVQARARAALQGLGPGEGLDGLLLVGRGTHHPEANGDMWKFARLFWERHRDVFPLVEAAFVSLAEPFVPQGVARLFALGARRVVVAPYFLDTGVLVRRIGDEARAAAAGLQGLALAVAAHIGVDPALVALLGAEAARAEQRPQAFPEVAR